MRNHLKSCLCLALGAGLFLLLGWRGNVPAAVSLAQTFLMRFMRTQRRWPVTLIAIPIAAAPLFYSIHGGWDMPLAAEIGVGFVRAAPFLIALYLDRFAVRRLPAGPATLVYPAAYTGLDYLLALSPLGSVFSAAVSQPQSGPLAQLAAVTGIWGIDFLLAWIAPVANLAWDALERPGVARAADPGAGPSPAPRVRAGRPIAALAACLVLVVGLGSLRLDAAPAAATVRVAGVTVEHPRDYWAEAIDLGTPEQVARGFAAELDGIHEQLFAASARAAQAGAAIVFWSEGNGVVYPEDEAAFIAASQAFARQHGIYFAPAYIVFRYGEATSGNKVVMITPAGEVAFNYTKTKSWYPTDSDGVIRTVDTPYGRIAAAICFDMDFPGFIRQAGRQGVDIMLVPAFDWEPIKPYHTQVGLYRALENGFSVVRQVNAGTSMAVDYQGRALAYQDFYTTADRVMFADVPVRGVRTPYAALGDWFAYLCLAATVALVLAGSAGRARFGRLRTQSSADGR